MKKNRKIVHNKVVFKEYKQEEVTLYPYQLGEIIPKNHLVRVIKEIVNNMKLGFLYKTYKGGGAGTYHPVMMLKALIYAYTQKIYSSRQIERALKENICFMWLCGGNTPNFRTINSFLSKKLKDKMEIIFTEILGILYEKKYIDLREYFLDGTKIEANANKYSFVWAKATEKFKKELQQKVKELMKEIEKINEIEDEKDKGNNPYEKGADDQITSKDIRQIAERIEEQIEDCCEEKTKKQLKKIAKKVRKDYLIRMEKYEEQESKFNGRNSYSKTDEEATFMRMKEDPMKNGQLKAGYNVKIGTQNQFILWYSIHQDRSDSGTLQKHLESFIEKTNLKPENLVADAGYGSEENYLFLARNGINSYVKYANYNIENRRKFKKDIFRKENFKYDYEKDEYICPSNRRFKFIYLKRYKKDNGRYTYSKIYECENCQDCQYIEKCKKFKNNRRIWISPVFEKYKKETFKNLSTEYGKYLSKKRSIDVESVFGDIKENMKFKRFNLRSISKVCIEWGLISIAHNMKKIQQKQWEYIYNSAKNLYFFILKIYIFHILLKY